MRALHHLLLECMKDVNGVIKRDYFPFRMKAEEDKLHLKRAVNWLVRSIKNGNGGSSSHYNLLSGRWKAPFPETTGYIIPTLYDYYAYSKETKYLFYAKNITEWLSEVQLDNGACMSGNFSPSKGTKHSVVFNTGQNILGFLRSYKEIKEPRFLESAIKAGNFLVKSTGQNGVWNKNLHHSINHTYNSRTCWSLLELFQITQNKKYKEIAFSNLDWVLKQQSENGWFENANFKPNELPNTHGIAYTLRGLVESYRLSDEKLFLDAAEKTAEKFRRIFETQKLLPTFWNKDWTPVNKFPGSTKYFRPKKWVSSCLTGNIQLAIIWMKIYKFSENLKYLNSAFMMLNHIKTLQNINSSNGGINGAIKGSHPIYGDYANFSYPNWATKFFIDAMLLKISLKSRLPQNFSDKKFKLD